MTVERVSWSMVKFTGYQGSPVYIDLRQVAAVTAPREDDPGLLPGMALGTRVILNSGLALYTQEPPDTVFEEVRRANTETAPEPPPMKVSGAAPAPEVPRIPAAPIARGPTSPHREGTPMRALTLLGWCAAGFVLLVILVAADYVLRLFFLPYGPSCSKILL